MFNFNKKKSNSYGSKNMEEYVPSSLPKNAEEGHTDLSTFITSDYSLLDNNYLGSLYKGLEDHMDPLIQISDEFTVGASGDAYIEMQMPVVRSKHAEEVAMHELSGANIMKARQVRMKELQERIPQVEETMEDLRKQIAGLKDKHAKHAVRIGSHIIQFGLPVTVMAFAADFFVNTQFVQSILYSNVAMLMILVICLCLMSDGTMFALGTLVSQKSDDMPKWLYRTFFTVFLSLFVASVLGSICIRCGSMPQQYGTFDAAGNFVGKDSFTVAEYALAIISSLATAVTGALSFFFSVDPDYYLEKDCIKLQRELSEKEKEHSQITSELKALQMAPDPMVSDRERRKAAEEILEALPEGLKSCKRKMFAVHQQNASYADAMAASAEKLLEHSDEEEHINAENTDNANAHGKKALFREAKDYKEAV